MASAWEEERTKSCQIWWSKHHMDTTWTPHEVQQYLDLWSLPDSGVHKVKRNVSFQENLGEAVKPLATLGTEIGLGFVSIIRVVSCRCVWDVWVLFQGTCKTLQNETYTEALRWGLSQEHPASLPALEGIEPGKAVGPQGQHMPNFWKEIRTESHRHPLHSSTRNLTKAYYSAEPGSASKILGSAPEDQHPQILQPGGPAIDQSPVTSVLCHELVETAECGQMRPLKFPSIIWIIRSMESLLEFPCLMVKSPCLMLLYNSYSPFNHQNFHD